MFELRQRVASMLQEVSTNTTVISARGSAAQEHNVEVGLCSYQQCDTQKEHINIRLSKGSVGYIAPLQTLVFFMEGIES